jgi:ABC-type multidrug transport system fused ATPase/permease subunit
VSDERHGRQAERDLTRWMTAASRTAQPVDPSQASGLRDLLRWMSPRRRLQLKLLFLLMLAGAVAELLAIGAVLPFLRLVIAPDAPLAAPMLLRVAAFFGWHRSPDLLIPAALLLIACAVGAAIVRLLLAWASQRFIYRLGYDMDAELFRKTVHQPYLTYLDRNSSETLAGFDKINNLIAYVLLPIMVGVTSAVIAACIVGLLFIIDPLTAVLTAGTMSLIYTGIALLSRRSLGVISQGRAHLLTARTKAVQEGLGGLRDIILDRSQPFHERRFATINQNFRSMNAQAAMIATTPRFVIEGAGVALIGLLAIYFTGRSGGLLTALPALGALALGAQRLIPLLQASYQAVIQYLGARRSLANVLDLMMEPMLERPVADDNLPPRAFQQDITLADVTFRYGVYSALTGISLVIPRGSRIGLIGPSGSGKSTLADLIMGLLMPTAGSILVDDEALTLDRIDQWQARIAHVPQSIFLADDTVAANIAFSGAGIIDMARVEEAAKLADIHDLAISLSNGYATMVGEGGIRLSGGQRQRIGIARALYKRADLLILDEATSALDDATEASIMAAIDGLGGDLTIVMIAHRLSTLKGCDTLYRLDRGRLVQQGSYAAVVGGLATGAA